MCLFSVTSDDVMMIRRVRRLDVVMCIQASRKLGITEVDLSRAEAGLEAAEA